LDNNYCSKNKEKVYLAKRNKNAAAKFKADPFLEVSQTRF
jgi:hypothetical protein